MKEVRPIVIKIGETKVDPAAMLEALRVIGVTSEYTDKFLSTRGTNGEALMEFAGRMCYDTQTEVLTDVGWRKGMDLNGGETVATLDQTTGFVEFQNYRLWKYEYRGEMLSIEHQHVSLLVTPEHRVYAKPDGQEYQIIQARHLSRHEYRFLAAGPTFPGETSISFTVPPAEATQGVANQYVQYGTRVNINRGSTIPHDPYLKLVGYYLSQGHLYQQPGSGAGMGLTQADGPVLDDMISTTKEAGLPLSVHADPRKPRVKFLHVGGGRALVAHFSRFGRGSRNKFIPREIMLMDSASLRLLYDAMCIGDGTVRASGARVYSTTSEKLADDVQELLLRLGLASGIHSYPLNGRQYYFVKELHYRNSPVVSPKHRRWIPYDGIVWCVTTKNGIILVRRNKKPVWCGNCYESYEPGLNPNVTRIRESSKDYFTNILARGDGSILEHAVLNFVILGITRVASHELVRHRVGTAVSQESLRYVRPREIGFWLPDELTPEQRGAMKRAVEQMEAAYRELELKVPWDNLPMDTKKRLTSALRRILPQGVTTNLVWSANHRTLRWVIEMRTDPAAEVEIRMIFDQIAEICKRDYPLIYGDFEATELPDGTRSWRPTIRSKV